MKLKSRRITTAILAGTALAFTVGACGNSSNNASKPSQPSTSTPAKAPQAAPNPVAQIDQLTGKQTAVKLDTGFVDALTSLKVTPAAAGNANLTSEGSIVLPITGGNVKYFDPNASYRPYVQGIIHHEGSGLSLTAGKTKVELTNFDVNPGTSKLMGDVSVNGKKVVSQAYLFQLDGSTLMPLKVAADGKTALLKGTTVKLSEDAAALLNKTFKIDALKADLVIGIASITLQLPATN